MSRALWKFFTSLRLTVVCLAFAILLVFLGTVAQVEEGLYTAQARWFRSFLVWFDFFGWHPAGWRLWLPLPGGYTVGCVLLVNLVAAHVKRFSWSVSKIGIQLTHLGVILLLVGQLATDMLARESYLSLHEGDARTYTEDHRDSELVFLTDAPNGADQVIAVPEALVARGGELTLPKLPLVVRIQQYHPNGELFSKSGLTETVNQLNGALATVEGQFSAPDALVPLAEKAMESPGRVAIWQQALAAVGETETSDLLGAVRRVQPQKERAEKLCAELKTRFRAQMLEGFGRAGGAKAFAARRLAERQPMEVEKIAPPATRGVGPQVIVVPQPESKDMNTRNLPYVVAEILESGASLGTWILSPMLDPQEITPAHSPPVRVAFRFQRIYHPFTVKLLKTTHEVYPGTVTPENPEGIPKNFQSRVEITNPAKNEQREVDIYMNNPLRYEGLTFFQYQMGKDEVAGRDVGTSTLQVVRNPSWLTPYLGCLIVAGGMAYQFLFHLIGFLSKRPPPKPRVPPGPAVRPSSEPAAVA